MILGEIMSKLSIHVVNNFDTKNIYNMLTINKLFNKIIPMSRCLTLDIKTFIKFSFLDVNFVKVKDVLNVLDITRHFRSFRG